MFCKARTETLAMSIVAGLSYNQDNQTTCSFPQNSFLDTVNNALLERPGRLWKALLCSKENANPFLSWEVRQYRDVRHNPFTKHTFPSSVWNKHTNVAVQWGLQVRVHSKSQLRRFNVSGSWFSSLVSHHPENWKTSDFHLFPTINKIQKHFDYKAGLD